MRLFRFIGLVTAVGSLVLGVWAADARPSGKVLLRVWLSGGRVRATYRLPTGMEPYGLSFWNSHEAGFPMMMLPGSSDGIVTQTAFTSSQLSASVLSSTNYTSGGQLKPITYAVYLLYGRVGSCGQSAAWNANNVTWKTIEACSHYRSNALPLTVGNLIGPGSLVQSSSGNGDFANASISASVTNPNTFTVRVSSSPSGQSVHIAWDITCTKGLNVKGASGSWDDYTPVSDNSSITVPFASITSNPDSCIVSVGASLQPDPANPDSVNTPGGTITLKVYVDKSHL